MRTGIPDRLLSGDRHGAVRHDHPRGYWRSLLGITEARCWPKKFAKPAGDNCRQRPTDLSIFGINRWSIMVSE